MKAVLVHVISVLISVMLNRSEAAERSENTETRRRYPLVYMFMSCLCLWWQVRGQSGVYVLTSGGTRLKKLI